MIDSRVAFFDPLLVFVFVFESDFRELILQFC